MNIYPLFFFLGYRERRFQFTLLPVVAAVIFLAPVFMNAMFHSGSPRYPGLSFPSKFFPAEKTQFATLPSNTNPRAFNRKIAEKFTLFFLNDNYNPIEGEAFWTYADKELEIFLLAPGRVKQITFQMKNIPRDNEIRIQIEHKSKNVFIAANDVRNITFSHIPGLQIANRFIYHIKIKSSKYYCPFFADAKTQDRRLLGVQTQIELGY